MRGGAAADATVTILGSGTSTGVPVIGCRCATCVSTDPRNNRLRASILVRFPSGDHVVVDTGPDFRLQMLRAGLRRLTDVLYTHTHADHCFGFDDLRAFYFHQRTPVKCHLAAEHIETFRRTFAYAFEDLGYAGALPQVTLSAFHEAPFQVCGYPVEPALLEHGHMRSAAFRIGRFAYATDFKRFPDAVVAAWRGGIDTMVASGVHFGPHLTHSNIPETLALFARLGVKRGIITHLSHDVDFVRDSAKLPPGVEFAVDGMTLSLPL